MIEAKNLLSIQQYAVKQKMSTFAVIKLINAKKLQTIKKSVDGDEQEYIIDDTQTLEKTLHSEKKTELEVSEKIDYEVEFHKLLEKYLNLQEKYTKLIEESKKS